MGIKPCPFCGQDERGLTDFGELILDLHTNDWGEWGVECWDCYAQGPHKETREKAVESWNDRKWHAAERPLGAAEYCAAAYEAQVKELLAAMREIYECAHAPTAPSTLLLKIANISGRFV